MEVDGCEVRMGMDEKPCMSLLIRDGVLTIKVKELPTGAEAFMFICDKFPLGVKTPKEVKVDMERGIHLLQADEGLVFMTETQRKDAAVDLCFHLDDEKTAGKS
jgi:hypothetical protein